MAAPRVFISSTFYDMKHVREDVARFVQQLGYDAVLFERGDVAYGSEENLESDCYKEVQLSDIVISIIGGRYGTEAKAGNGSISQHELKTAFELKKKVYVFIQADVHAEYRTFEKNENISGITYANVDDPKVYKFIRSLHSIAHKNSITSFSNSSDISDFLKKQWAGLFQRMLSTLAEMDEGSAVQKLVRSVSTLDKLVGTLSDIPATLTESFGSDTREGIKAVLLMEHPVFDDIKQELGLKYRVAFYTLSELTQLAESLGFFETDDENVGPGEYHHWKRIRTELVKHDGHQKRSRERVTDIFMVTRSIFDDTEKLRPMKPSEYRDIVDPAYGRSPVETFTEYIPAIPIDDDDIPF